MNFYSFGIKIYGIINLRMNNNVGIILSIIYLYVMCTSYRYDYNTIGVSDNWFLHPEHGGSCVFGQLMAFVSSIILLGCIYFYTYLPVPTLLYLLAFGWTVGSYFMNNSWLAVVSIPLALLWIGLASTN
jgi:hypothetical protein